MRDDEPGGDSASRQGDRRALLAAFLLFVALALFGQRYHWVEEAGTAATAVVAASSSYDVRLLLLICTDPDPLVHEIWREG